MPFKSEAQRRFMHAKHPKIAKKWERHTPKGKKLPKKVKKKKKKKTSKESFVLKLDTALGLINESEPSNAQSTNQPNLGASKGPTKGGSSKDYGKSLKRSKKPKGKKTLTSG